MGYDLDIEYQEDPIYFCGECGYECEWVLFHSSFKCPKCDEWHDYIDLLYQGDKHVS